MFKYSYMPQSYLQICKNHQNFLQGQVIVSIQHKKKHKYFFKVIIAIDIRSASCEIALNQVPKKTTGAVRRQAITRAYVGPDICRRNGSLGRNELTEKGLNEIATILYISFWNDFLNTCLLFEFNDICSIYNKVTLISAIARY